jgi:hypothetical protein
VDLVWDSVQCQALVFAMLNFQVLLQGVSHLDTYSLYYIS